MSSVREVREAHGGIAYDEALVDSLCAGLVLRPQDYDVLVAPNCWGDIVSDLAGGIVGSLGLLGSVRLAKRPLLERANPAAQANVGAEHQLFEASHGSAPDIAGQDKVNPISMMLSANMLLEAVGCADAARATEAAIRSSLADGCATADLGGSASTTEFVDEVVQRLGSA